MQDNSINLNENLPQQICIDDEFAALIPPLSNDEFTRLEQSILHEGCRDPIIIWGNIIVDGHNRYKICSIHKIPYSTRPIEFSDRNSAMLWMLQNQLARRNLNDFQRIELVRKFEAAVKAQAKERQLSELKQNQDTVRENFPTRGRASDELGNLAGVSRKTYEHATAVLDSAPEEVIQAARNQELSINSAYEVTKLPQEQQDEISLRIQQGEIPRKVLSDIKQKSKVASTSTTLCIQEYEDIINGSRQFDELSDNYTLFNTYQHCKRIGSSLLNFDNAIFEYDVTPIVHTLRRAGISQFTISGCFSRIIFRLADFNTLGFKVQDIINVDTLHSGNVPAILLRDVKQ